MTTIQGTDGDTTGSVVAAWKTAANVTAALLAATHSAQGAMTAAEFDQLAASVATLGSIPSGATIGAWVTPTINFMTATSITNITMPLAAGKKFHLAAGRIALLTRDATLTTGLTWNLAQNGVTVSGSVGTSTGSLSALTPPMNTSAAPASVNDVDMTSFPLQFQVTVGVAGAGLTTCTGYYILVGYYL